MTSSSESKGDKHTTGPKISSCMQAEESDKSVMMVGRIKYPYRMI
jgi:hypothetical protein